MSRKSFVLAGVLFLAPVSARAEDPYYFHKAGVSRESYMEDVGRCAELAGGLRVTNYRAQAINPGAPYAMESAAIATFFLGFLVRAERRRLMSRIERTCMADKGYQRRSIDKPLNSEIRKLEGPVRLDRLFGLVAAVQPLGKVLVE